MQYSLNGGAFQTSNTFDNLPAGGYTIDVIDENSCEDSRMVAVRDLDGPTLGLDSSTDIDCTTPTGSLTVSASSGTAPYGYSLDGDSFQDSGTFTNLAAGSYTVQVRDANACLDATNVDIEDNIPLLIENIQAVATTCGDEDGAITVVSNAANVRFAIDGVNFQTSPQFFDLPAGTYAVAAINDTGCAETIEINVADSDPVAVPTIDITPTSCGLDNGIITLTPTSNQSIQYAIGNLPFQSVNRFTGMAAGEYTLAMINEEDCEASAALTVAPSTPLEIEAVEVTPSSCGADDGIINLLTNRNPGLLNFFLNGQSVPGRLAGLAPGRYFVAVADTDNCTDSTMVDVDTEICEIYIPNAFSPNRDGTNDFFKIYVPRNLNIQIESFAVYDRWGAPVYEFYPQGQEFELNDMRWDGTINGEPANLGVYVYALVYIDENNYRQVVSGDVILLR
jgi:gliding motility-associated-like protein